MKEADKRVSKLLYSVVTGRDVCQEESRAAVRRHGEGGGQRKYFGSDEHIGMSEEVTFDQDLKEMNKEPCEPLGMGGCGRAEEGLQEEATVSVNALRQELETETASSMGL